MADAAKSSMKKKNRGAKSYENDIYTALMGLTLLSLIATVVYVCIRSNELFGTIF